MLLPSLLLALQNRPNRCFLTYLLVLPVAAAADTAAGYGVHPEVRNPDDEAGPTSADEAAAAAGEAAAHEAAAVQAIPGDPLQPTTAATTAAASTSGAHIKRRHTGCEAPAGNSMHVSASKKTKH
jgi:hypothetical protein